MITGLHRRVHFQQVKQQHPHVPPLHWVCWTVGKHSSQSNCDAVLVWVWQNVLVHKPPCALLLQPQVMWPCCTTSQHGARRSPSGALTAMHVALRRTGRGGRVLRVGWGGG